jgi:outer membrane protein assembly factor BamA
MKTVSACLLALMFAPLFCAAGPKEGSGLIVEDIRCKGNVVSSCPFIRGYLHLAPGDRLNEGEIQNAKLRLASLPDFISADIHLAKGSQKGKVLVILEVLEADRVENEFTTGTSSRLSSYSQTIEGRIADHDVFGTRNTLNLDVEGIVPLGGLTRDGIYSRLQFVDPKLFDASRYFLIAGVAYQNSRTDYPNGDFDKTDQLGIDISVGRRVFDYSYVTLGYLHRAISDSVSQYRGRSGVFSTDTNPNSDKGLSFGYGWDSEDDPYFPTRGSRLSSSFGSSWASVRFRKTWSSGTDAAWTVQFGGTPGTQYRNSLIESQDFSIAYGHAIAAGDAFGGIRQGRWYIEPGLSYYGTSATGRDLAEWGLKAGIRLDTKTFGVIELYLMASTSQQLGGGR